MWGESILAFSYRSAMVEAKLFNEAPGATKPSMTLQPAGEQDNFSSKFTHRVFLNQEMLLEVRRFCSTTWWKNRQKPQRPAK